MFFSTVDNQLQINSSNSVQEIPRCMYINREELLPDKHKRAAYNFPNGNFNHLELKYFRGLPVAVRAYESTVIDEAKIILSLPSHPCLPVLIGVCCDMKPYLLITMFCGNMRRVFMSLTGLLTCDDIDVAQWMGILLGLAEGLHLMHSHGIVHGSLKTENIIMRKEKARPSVFFPIFFNLEKVKPVDEITCASACQQDISMFAGLIGNIITGYRFDKALDLSALTELSDLVKMGTSDLNLQTVISYIKKYCKMCCAIEQK